MTNGHVAHQRYFSWADFARFTARGFVLLIPFSWLFSCCACAPIYIVDDPTKTPGKQIEERVQNAQLTAIYDAYVRLTFGAAAVVAMVAIWRASRAQQST